MLIMFDPKTQNLHIEPETFQDAFYLGELYESTNGASFCDSKFGFYMDIPTKLTSANEYKQEQRNKSND